MPHGHIDKALPWVVPFMGKIRRGNHVFLTWKGRKYCHGLIFFGHGLFLERFRQRVFPEQIRALALIRELQAEGLL